VAAAQGDSAAVENTLSKFYQNERQRAATSFEAMPEAMRGALPDPKQLGPERAVQRTLEVAAGVDPADAPDFYRQALRIADENPKSP